MAVLIEVETEQRNPGANQDVGLGLCAWQVVCIGSVAELEKYAGREIKAQVQFLMSLGILSFALFRAHWSELVEFDHVCSGTSIT